MIVREDSGQLSFLFQEPAPCFELSCKILEQENIVNMLPFEVRHRGGSEELIFSFGLPNIVHLPETLDKFSNNDIIDLLYELIFVCEKVEENGFLKKECIWYKYDHIFYDLERKCPMLAVLPITGEFRYCDSVGWGKRLGDAVSHIAGFLPENKAGRVNNIVAMFAGGCLGISSVLDEINRLGAGTSELLVDKAVEQDTVLRLIYVSRNGDLAFDIARSDFIIGKDKKEAGGVVPDNISRAVSRRHCNIIKLNNRYFVQDLDSTNHTFVNGGVIPAYEIMELSDNDILGVADVEFRVRINQT